VSKMAATPMSPGLRIDAHRLVILLAVVLSQFVPNGSIAAEVNGSDQQDQSPPLGTVPVVGSVFFWRTSQMATPVVGRIQLLPVRVGDHVKKGDVVAEIEKEQLLATLAVAQSEIINAQSQLAVADAQLVLETTTRDRQEKLKGSPGFRRATLEDANNRVAVASAAVEAAKSRIIVTQADAARQEVNVNLATIKAPFDGVVVRYLLTVGALVSDYNPSILVMVDYSTPEIEIEVPIEDLSSVSVGMEMTYSLNSGRRQQAKVRAVLPSITPNAKTRIVRLDPENLEERPTFSEGQLVTVYVPKS
jgi:RND family efflux transporter MFP subunit